MKPWKYKTIAQVGTTCFGKLRREARGTEFAVWEHHEASDSQLNIAYRRHRDTAAREFGRRIIKHHTY